MRCRHRNDRGGSIVGALTLIALGCVFLAATLIPGLSIEEVFGRGWPIFMIGLGVITLIGNIVKAPFRGRLAIGGPVILITLGILFSLQNFAGIAFHRTWPVLLVVIGIGMVFKRLAGLPLLPFVGRRL
jgi:hypothetical protein